MIEQTGETYSTGKYEKALCVAEPKVGKTVFLASSILGVLPWQKNGGVVDRPDHLHILSFDQAALEGIKPFQEMVGASTEALKYRVWNFQDDVRRIASGNDDYDFSLFNTIIATVNKVRDIALREKGVHAVLISSVTRAVEAIQRGLFGPPARRDAHEDEFARKKSKGSADENKWVKFAQLVSELRDFVQADDWHTFWEGHISKTGGEEKKDSLAIQGKSGTNFALNVEHVYRIRRMINQKYENTKVDKVIIDTQPTLDFLSNGRCTTEKLNPQEADLTLVIHKLGFRCGYWGRKNKNG